MFGDIRGDDSWMQIYKNNSPSYSDLFTITSSDGVIKSTWQDYYSAIYRANTILTKIEEAEIEAVPNKERYIGEARFLRALAYFDLVRIFGAVPAVTTPVSIEGSYRSLGNRLKMYMRRLSFQISLLRNPLYRQNAQGMRLEGPLVEPLNPCWDGFI